MIGKITSLNEEIFFWMKRFFFVKIINFNFAFFVNYSTKARMMEIVLIHVWMCLFQTRCISTHQRGCMESLNLSNESDIFVLSWSQNGTFKFNFFSSTNLFIENKNWSNKNYSDLGLKPISLSYYAKHIIVLTEK